MEVIFEKQYDIGNKNIIVTVDFNKNKFPILYKRTKLNQESFWEIYVVDNSIFRHSGIVGKKIRNYEVIKGEYKNKGKKNELNPFLDAISQAHTLWKKQLDKGYLPCGGINNSSYIGNYEYTIQTNITLQNINDCDLSLRPMLAHNYNEHNHKIIFPVAVSTKLDGIRTIVQLYDQNTPKINLLSRRGKSFKFLSRIREDVAKLLNYYNSPLILDGELYSHDLTFNEITGSVKTIKKPSNRDNVIQLWIYDIINDDTYINRSKILFTLKDIITRYNLSSLRIVLYDTATNNEEVESFHSKFVSEGFEGLILRNFNGKY